MQILKDPALDKDEAKFINKVEEIVPIFNDLVYEILDTSHIYIHGNEFRAISTTIGIKVKSPGALRPKTYRQYLAEKVDFI